MIYNKEYIKNDIKDLIKIVSLAPIFIIIFIYIAYFVFFMPMQFVSNLQGIPTTIGNDFGVLLITSFPDFMMTFGILFGIFASIFVLKYFVCLKSKRCFSCGTKIQEGERIIDKCTLCKQVEPFEIIQLRIRGWIRRKPAKIIIHDSMTNESVTYKL